MSYDIFRFPFHTSLQLRETAIQRDSAECRANSLRAEIHSKSRSLASAYGALDKLDDKRAAEKAAWALDTASLKARIEELELASQENIADQRSLQDEHAAKMAAKVCARACTLTAYALR